MVRFERLGASCLLLVIAAACTRWDTIEPPEPQEAEEADDQVHAADPPQAEGTESPAAAGQPLAEPEPAAAADPQPAPAEEPTGEATEEATAADPPPAVAIARLLPGGVLLGTALENPQGDVVGVIEDVLIDPVGGAVAGVLVALPAPDGGSRPRILEYEKLSWSAKEPGVPAIVLEQDLSGILARDAEYAGLFVGQESASVQGEVTEFELLPGGGTRAVILKIHDQGNLLHRVLVEPAALVRRTLSGLAPAAPVKVEGVFTRDTTGKLLVAKTITQGGVVLALRDASGAIEWGALARRFQSARGLPEMALMAGDGSSLKVRGWILDRIRGAAAYLCLELDGTVRALPWDQAERSADGRAWSVKLGPAELSALRAVTADGNLEGNP